MTSFRWRKFCFAVLVVSMGSGLQDGYQTGILNIPSTAWISKIKSQRETDKVPSVEDIKLIWSTIIAMFSVGAIVGGLMTHHFSEKCGRKWGLFWNTFVELAAIGLLFWSKYAHSYELFMLGRFLSGINTGLNAGITQIYLIEISPNNIRGAVGSFYQLFIVCSMLLGHFCGNLLGTEHSWHMMFLISIFPALLQIFSLPFCPESPKQLMMGYDNHSRSEQALFWLRGTTEIDNELKELNEEDNMVKEFGEVTLKRLFSEVSLLTPLILCIMIAAGHRLCGVQCIMYYSTEVMEDVGFSSKAANIITIITAILNIFATLIGVLLVDSLGRRILLLISVLAMAVFSILTWIFFILADTYVEQDVTKYIGTFFGTLFMMSYCIGLGPIAWFITAELFSYSARATAVSITVSVNFFCNFIITQIFLPLEHLLSYYIFFVSVTFNVFFFFFLMVHLPETAQLSPTRLMMLYDYVE